MIVRINVGAGFAAKHPVLGRLRLEPFTPKLVQQHEHTQQADHNREA
jgi:hypothetical protein